MNNTLAVESQSAPRLPLSMAEKPVRIGVIGLGYVGLPLAAEFGRLAPTRGLDINADRIAELHAGRDTTGQLTREALSTSGQLELTSKPRDLQECNVFIVTVPTPVNRFKQPDLTLLEQASLTTGRSLQKGDVVIFESTVYPGATEEICRPALERVSGLKCNEDFHIGYSPERINPGDEARTLKDIPKVTSASTPEAAEFVDQLYRCIVEAGTHRVSSIRVAEAAKVIENTQRDVNIALINELSMLFRRLEINTEEVLNAAGTKWNFLPFTPGLVGGHCIGVDPYYLTQKAQEIGYFPEMILAGRRINDGMGNYVVESVVRLMAQHCIQVVNARVLVMGLTFKENCPDLRNSQAADLVEGLKYYRARPEVYDPRVSPEEAEQTYGITPVDNPENASYDAIIIAVGHHEFREMGAHRIRSLGKRDASVIFDVKHLLPADAVDGQL